jgi:hypothetical protein
MAWERWQSESVPAARAAVAVVRELPSSLVDWLQPIRDEDAFVARHVGGQLWVQDYDIFAGNGSRVVVVREESVPSRRFATGRLDPLAAHRCAIVDSEGNRVLTLTRPSYLMRARCAISMPDGSPILAMEQRHSLFRRKVDVRDETGDLLARVAATSGGWAHMEISDAAGAYAELTLRSALGVLFPAPPELDVVLTRAHRDSETLVALAAPVGIFAMFNSSYWV